MQDIKIQDNDDQWTQLFIKSLRMHMDANSKTRHHIKRSDTLKYMIGKTTSFMEENKLKRLKITRAVHGETGGAEINRSL